MGKDESREGPEKCSNDFEHHLRSLTRFQQVHHSLPDSDKIHSASSVVSGSGQTIGGEEDGVYAGHAKTSTIPDPRLSEHVRYSLWSYPSSHDSHPPSKSRMVITTQLVGRAGCWLSLTLYAAAYFRRGWL
ncbi:hypothetical protein BDV06DRAFT_87450 [Aspergillus oleicola]